VQTVIETKTNIRQATMGQHNNAQYHPTRRFLKVLTFFLGVIAHIYFWDIFLTKFALTRWYARRSAMRRWVVMARHFRHLALQLGGMHIKLGQFLSSRADIIPEAVRRELAGLQDEVPAAPAEHVLSVIIEQLGAPPEEVFLSFDREAVAAASLGQVHFATLHNGREVAVKVQRPFIDEIIEIDLNAASWIVRLIKNYPPIKRRVDLEALIAEFARVLRQELDYVNEARNAEIFRSNFADYSGVYTPQPINELTRPRVLVMERISGTKITDLRRLDELGVSREELAARLNSAYLKQFFIDGFFHADPHPGNLFVRVEPQLPIATYTNGHEPPDQALPPDANAEATPVRGTPFTLIFVDFGMTGHMPPETMSIVRGGVIGLATNDAERIVDALEKLNMILAGADRRQIVQAIQVMLRYSYNRTVRELNNMDVEAIFDETREMIYDLPFQVPQDLLYLGRAMSMVGGLATEIDPDINLFEALRPFARNMMDQERRSGDWNARIQAELREMGQILINLPRQMDEYYRSANRGDMQMRTDFGRLERSMRRVENSTDRLAGSMLATGFFLGGVQMRNRGMDKEADRAWMAAAAAVLWAFWPRGN
jgi:predicted unusual protein kinase regulating ubiquinone biosynthesis (AarF/ABC1/UbiB family)